MECTNVKKINRQELHRRAYDLALDLFHSARERGRVHGVVLSSASGLASEMAQLLPALLS